MENEPPKKTRRKKEPGEKRVSYHLTVAPDTAVILDQQDNASRYVDKLVKRDARRRPTPEP